MKEREESYHEVVVVGAGPAGLAAGYELSARGVKVAILEKEATVGGMSKTLAHNGYFFEIGGHRFYSNDEEVNRLWRELLGPDFISVPRLSRIYYGGKYFNYPLTAWNALKGLGLFNAWATVGSYVWTRIFPFREDKTFEQWVSNRFGHRLFRTFFKTYTEKVWGKPCSQIEAEMASICMEGLSLISALRNLLLGRDTGAGKGPANQFQYPVLGPGMMYEAMKSRIEENGGEVLVGWRAVSVVSRGDRIEQVEASGPNGTGEFAGEDFISSMPLNLLIQSMRPQPPGEVLEAAMALRYRGLVVVHLVLDQDRVFPDNWLYIHSPEVRMGRIQNYKNWSVQMVPEPGKTSLGVEYFCSEGDALWRMGDRDIVSLAAEELERLGLTGRERVMDGFVTRTAYAYPVYFRGYKDVLQLLRRYLCRFENLQVIGRSGMYRYNTMDDSMLLGLLAARNVLGARHHLWEISPREGHIR